MNTETPAKPFPILIEIQQKLRVHKSINPPRLSHTSSNTVSTLPPLSKVRDLRRTIGLVALTDEGPQI